MTAAKLNIIIERWGEYKTDYKDLSIRDLTIAGATAQDKELLLSGEATSRTESLTTLTIEQKRATLREYEDEFLKLHSG